MPRVRRRDGAAASIVVRDELLRLRGARLARREARAVLARQPRRRPVPELGRLEVAAACDAVDVLTGRRRGLRLQRLAFFLGERLFALHAGAILPREG